jgi:porin
MMLKPHHFNRPVGRVAIVLAMAAGLTFGRAVSASAQVQHIPLSGLTFAPATGTQQTPLTVQDWMQRPEMLGDWGGIRRKAAVHGLRIDASWTQFFQSSPRSDDTRGWDYGGRIDVKAKQDFTTMGWDGVSAVAKLIFRYGDTPLLAGGTFLPTNSALLFPDSEGTFAQISSVYLSRTFGTSAVVSAGRFDMVDMYDRTFTGGNGLDKFNNLAFVMPPLTARTTPPVAEGVFYTALKNQEPLITVGLYESTEEGFFKNGATFFASFQVPYKLFETPSHYIFTATASSISANSLDQSPFVFIPALGVPPVVENNAWTFDFTFDQYLYWDPQTRTGIGLFGMIGASDSNPTPFDIFGHIGVGGNSPIKGRSQDNFGAGYYFGGVSNTLIATLDPFIRLRDENGFEGFYNFAVTGWSKVAADFQYIDPFAVGSKTRFFFSVRWKLTF